MGYRMMHILPVVLAGLIGQPWSAALADDGSLILPRNQDDPVIMSLQAAPQALGGADILQVFVGPPDACCVGKTPMAGTYNLVGRTVTFDPAFDFIAGQTYTVQSRDGGFSLTCFAINSDGDIPAPKVLAIYPSGSVIPENTLRFYIQFSTPMMPHRADGFIKLLDANGDPDSAAFMSFTQELWNEDRTRLTLLMDPGRIKRGVAQNVALGPALLAGNQYSIVVDGGWPAAIGTQNAPWFEHAFTVSEALRSLPDIDLWQVQPPTLGSAEPLVIAFDRPFDQQQAQTAISVLDMDGQQISGAVTLTENERMWRFAPDAPWAAPRLQISVNTRFEDVAGNNFRDLLDHALGTAENPKDQQIMIIDLPVAD